MPSRLTDSEKAQLHTLLEKVRGGKQGPSSRFTKLSEVIKSGPLYPSAPNSVTGWSKRKIRHA